MKGFIIFILLLFAPGFGLGQTADDYFVASANSYVNSKLEMAMQTIDEGLDRFPNNPKLLALKKKIEEEKKEDQKQGDSNKDGDNSEDGKKESENNDSPQDSNQQDGRNKGEKGSGNSDKQPRNQRNKDNDEGNPNDGLDLQQQRYNQILKALKRQEQNTQRRLMMGENRTRMGRNQKDW